MIVTATHPVEGFRIARCKGIVAGKAISGATIVREMCATVTDIRCGISSASDKDLARARETAPSDPEEQARSSGATAVVGVDIASNGVAVRLG